MPAAARSTSRSCGQRVMLRPAAIKTEHWRISKKPRPCFALAPGILPLPGAPEKTMDRPTCSAAPVHRVKPSSRAPERLRRNSPPCVSSSGYCAPGVWPCLVCDLLLTLCARPARHVSGGSGAVCESFGQTFCVDGTSTPHGRRRAVSRDGVRFCLLPPRDRPLYRARRARAPRRSDGTSGVYRRPRSAALRRGRDPEPSRESALRRSARASRCFRYPAEQAGVLSSDGSGIPPGCHPCRHRRGACSLGTAPGAHSQQRAAAASKHHPPRLIRLPSSE